MTRDQFGKLLDAIEKIIKKFSKKSKVSEDFIPKVVPHAKLWKFMASLGGAGYFPVASGTAGTFLAYILLVIFYKFDPFFTTSLWFLVITFISLPIGAIICQRGEDMWGHDSGKIVFDELVGLLFTVIFLRVNLFTLFFAFLFFRIFDIVKLPPGRIIDEKLPGGWGVLLDDVVAGLLANATLQIFTTVAFLWRV